MATTTTCPVCGDTAVPPGDASLHSGRVFTVHHCGSCDLIFTTPEPTDHELDVYYASGVATAESGYSLEYLTGAHDAFLQHPPTYLRITRDWLLELLRDRLSGGSFLEVGCNLGLLSELLIPTSGMIHYGIELNTKAVEFCNARARFAVEATRFEHKPFPDKMFDCIGLFDVFEHLPRPEEFVGLARERLKPGGLMLLAVPNTGTLDVKLVRALKKLRGRDHFPTVLPLFHLYGYNLKNLEVLFKWNGFTLVTSKTYRFEHYGPAAKKTAPHLKFNLNRLLGRAISSVRYVTRDDKLLVAFRKD